MSAPSRRAKKTITNLAYCLSAFSTARLLLGRQHNALLGIVPLILLLKLCEKISYFSCKYHEDNVY